MNKNIVIFFMVIVCLSVEIEANVCRVSAVKTVNVTVTYTYSYLVTYYGKCYYGDECLLSRWETRVRNKTIERPDIEYEYKCCPGWRDISTNVTGLDLVCVPDNSTLEMNPTTYNKIRTTTTERPEYNDSIPYRRHTDATEADYNGTKPVYRRRDYGNGYMRPVSRRHTTERSNKEPEPEWPYYGPVPDDPNNWGYTTTTEINNNRTNPFYPSYRRYTTSTERNYENTAPLSTKRNYENTVPPYRRYTTSTESNYEYTAPLSTKRNYENTVPPYRRYTTSTESNYEYTAPLSTKRNYENTVPPYRRYTTSTERNYENTAPLSTKRNYENTVPPYRRYTTSTESNYEYTAPLSTKRNYENTVPPYRRYTTSTESNYEYTAPLSTKRNYENTVPPYRRYTTSTESNYEYTAPLSTKRNYENTVPPYRRYTTSTESNYEYTAPLSTKRNYENTVPPYRRYTTSTERSYENTVPPYRRYRTSTERSYENTVPPYRGYTHSTERNTYNTEPYHRTTSPEERFVLVRHHTSNLNGRETASNKKIWSIPMESLPDIDEPYRPYNWNNTTYKRKPTDYYIPTNTAPADTNETEKLMCPKERRILIMTSIILVFTVLCVMLLAWRIILLKKYQASGRPVVDQGPKTEIQDMYNATYTATETKAKINSIYPSTTDLKATSNI